MKQFEPGTGEKEATLVVDNASGSEPSNWHGRLRDGTVRPRTVPTQSRFGTKSKDGEKNLDVEAGWRKRSTRFEPPASTPNSYSRQNRVVRQRDVRRQGVDRKERTLSGAGTTTIACLLFVSC